MQLSCQAKGFLIRRGEREREREDREKIEKSGGGVENVFMIYYLIFDTPLLFLFQ